MEKDKKKYLLVIPAIPPTINHYYKKIKPFRNRKGFYVDRALGEKGRIWKRTAGIAALEQGMRPTKLPLQVTFTIDKHDKRTRDLDNFGKALCDGLEKICWENDRQIKSLTIQWGTEHGAPKDQTTVTYQTLTGGK